MPSLPRVRIRPPVHQRSGQEAGSPCPPAQHEGQQRPALCEHNAAQITTSSRLLSPDSAESPGNYPEGQRVQGRGQHFPSAPLQGWGLGACQPTLSPGTGAHLERPLCLSIAGDRRCTRSGASGNYPLLGSRCLSRPGAQLRSTGTEGQEPHLQEPMLTPSPGPCLVWDPGAPSSLHLLARTQSDSLADFFPLANGRRICFVPGGLCVQSRQCLALASMGRASGLDPCSCSLRRGTHAGTGPERLGPQNVCPGGGGPVREPHCTRGSLEPGFGGRSLSCQ